MSTDTPSTPDALLLLSSGCPHCPIMLKTLSELLKQGAIGRLEAVNIEHHPEQAAEVGTRSVPWARIGLYEFQGAITPAELEGWVVDYGTVTGMSRYLTMLLKEGQLAKAEQLIQQSPKQLQALIPLIEETDTEMTVRIGVGALLEGVEGEPALTPLLTELARLSGSEDANIRADVCHYLGLSLNPEARPHLEQRINDDSSEVREIAAESLLMINNAAEVR